MCGGPQWKREVVPDHKFDFIDTRDFADHSCWTRTRYCFLFIVVLKSFLVYVFDIFTAITMLTTKKWSNHIFDSCQKGTDNGCVFIPFNIGRWLFVGCIIFSFLLLAYEARKARKIILSRDISYAFTNVMANNYYSLRSYDHYCFFCTISNSTRKIDDFAFFVFFTFKSWKRLMLADGPRQVINALTLYSFYLSQKDNGPFWDLNKYTNGSIITGALIFSTLSTVIIFVGSALLLLAAGICYVPLLCHIQGNLKEYCCHKVDKRISEIVRKKKKERLAQLAKLAKKEAAGDFSHLKNKKGELIHNPLPQPTLPNIKLDDDDFDDSTSVRTRVPGADYYKYSSDYNGADYPPAMPGYNQYGYEKNDLYSPSSHVSHDETYAYYNDGYDSKVTLTASPAPLSRQPTKVSYDSRSVLAPTPAPLSRQPTNAAYQGTYGQDPYSYAYGTANGHVYGQEMPVAYAVSGDPNEYGQYGQYGQAYSAYGTGQDQYNAQGGYQYDGQPEYMIPPMRTGSVPPRTASRAQNHQIPYAGMGHYDAYGGSRNT